MAYLTSDRGQLLLVGGFVVAITIVSVALLLNTVVMTDAVESREPPRDLDHAQEHAAITEGAVERIVLQTELEENRSWVETVENTTWDVRRLGELFGNRTLQGSGAFSDVSTKRTRRGAAIVQNESRNFTNESFESTWTLAMTEGVRNYHMHVNVTNLTELNDADATNLSLLETVQVFTVNVTGGGDTTWKAFLTRTSDTDQLRIVTQFNSDPPEIACTRNNSTIDWTQGTVGGEPCGFEFARDLTVPYTLRYEDGNAAVGRYHLVVSDTPADSVNEKHFDPDGNPRQYPAMYAMVVTAIYDGPSVEWATHIRVAPEEPPQTSTA